MKTKLPPPEVGMVIHLNGGFQRWRIVSTCCDNVTVRRAGSGNRTRKYSLCSLGGWPHIMKDGVIVAIPAEGGAK